MMVWRFQGEIYKGVINDVILQVKEAFLDENVDIDVLQQLKKVPLPWQSLTGPG